MALCALGPAYVIMRARDGGVVQTSDFATGYGMSVIAAVVGASISIRQILLHIVPPDPGYSKPVLGLHLYTWALLVFVAQIVASGLTWCLRASSSRRRRPVSAGSRSSCSWRWAPSSPRTRLRSLPRRGCIGPCPTTRTATDCSSSCADEVTRLPQTGRSPISPLGPRPGTLGLAVFYDRRLAPLSIR